MNNKSAQDMIPIEILSTGLYVPGSAITNSELKQLAGIEFDQAKIESKLGIYQRHIAHLRNITETTADFATKAALNAIKNAGIEPQEIGLLIVATDTPEFITPATAILVQGRIQKGEFGTMAFDIAASCASFSMAFDTAASLLASHSTMQYALVIGVYNMPAFMRPGDAFGYPIFADGAGAFILKKASHGKACYLGSHMVTDGTQWDYIGIYAGGSKNPITHELLDSQKQGLLNLQTLPGDRNVRLWPMVVSQLLEKTGYSADQIDHYIFTQINRSVILKVMDALNQPYHKAHFVMDKYGYTGSACLPMAFNDAIIDKKIKKGDKVLFVASGAGLSVGSNLFIY